MQTLRNAHAIARFVLVWFALSLGVAIASPMVKPQAMQLVCSGVGTIKLVATDTDNDTSPAPLTLDCPLCTGLGNVPPFEAVAFGIAAPQQYLVPAYAADPVVSVPVVPAPARAPPATA